MVKCCTPYPLSVTLAPRHSCRPRSTISVSAREHHRAECTLSPFITKKPSSRWRSTMYSNKLGTKQSLPGASTHKDPGNVDLPQLLERSAPLSSNSNIHRRGHSDMLMFDQYFSSFCFRSGSIPSDVIVRDVAGLKPSCVRT